MPKRFDSFFDSGCPIPATLAPLALHCLLNQFKMPSFELTFKALWYSVYYFSFLSFLPNSSFGSLSLLCYSFWLFVFNRLLWLCVDSHVSMTSLMLWALPDRSMSLSRPPSDILHILQSLSLMPLLQEPILSRPASNIRVNLSLLHAPSYMHLLLNYTVIYSYLYLSPIKLWT